MYYTLDLRTIGIIVGLALLVGHLFAAVRGEDVRRFLTAFPRNYVLGVVLMTVVLAWYWWVIYVMELGEFTSWKRPLLIFLPVAYLGAIFYMQEFLAARALAMLMLLAAMPVLDAAFMQPPQSRLLVVTLAYVWVFLGMWWVSSPFRMRDCAGWIIGSPLRWTLAVWGGVLYGVAVLTCAFAWW
ncbi:MAG: hypothetical protein JSR82_22105 [Verrucomicrobia bacterium]|nr:hypothetical protein [Verrucomicrobiota bacterium]